MYNTPGDALLAEMTAHLANAELAHAQVPLRRMVIAAMVFFAWSLVILPGDFVPWFGFLATFCAMYPFAHTGFQVMRWNDAAEGALRAYDGTRQRMSLYLASLEAEAGYHLPAAEK